MSDEKMIIRPEDIEKKSFEIITGMLGNHVFKPLHEPIIKRVIHTTADFEYAGILKISENAVEKGIEAIRGGSNIVTDTRMAAAGIRKKSLEGFGGKVVCHMDDPEIASLAKSRSVTRALVSMEKATGDLNNRIFVIGNAPTALIRICEFIEEGCFKPELIIGVPVGFVNVLESKDILKKTGIPHILTEGRKGGSTVAAAIVNAILILSQ
jgi:precorrin-8X/cobalt-precorrin-8 methylmutase